MSLILLEFPIIQQSVISPILGMFFYDMNQVRILLAMEIHVTNSGSNIWYDYFNKPRKFHDPVKPIQKKKSKTRDAGHKGNVFTSNEKKEPRFDGLLMDLLEDIYNKEQDQMNTLSQVQYLAIRPELKRIFSEKIKSTKECIEKLKDVLELADKTETQKII